MKITLPIAKLALLIEEYKQFKLQDNKEVLITDLEISVPTPHGRVGVNHFIKKFNLPILEILLENGYRFKAAETHIVRKNGVDTYLKDISVGDMVDHRNGPVCVLEINSANNEDCYDISIPAPHLYFDANGVIHHNTITTATLAKVCEAHGRTITIVPNKSLVEQTEDDFVNCGLDVGVYYGDRKNTNRTHTIATWQSLNILEKKAKNAKLDQDEVLSLAEFLDGVKTVMVDECFAADTLITTPNGEIPIKDLKPGDTVINFCEKTKKYKEDIIVKVHKNLTHSLSETMLELVFDNGVKIQVTANHKFFTNKGWVRADQLSADMEIIDINTYK